MKVLPVLPSRWPPIIEGVVLSPFVRWRDGVLTLAMWLLLIWFCRHGLIDLWRALPEPIGRSHWDIPGLAERWATLRPYFVVVAIFGTWVFLWGLVQLRRRRRVLSLPQPEPLAPEIEAARAGCSVEDLMRWRALRLCVVRVGDDGKIAVEPGNASRDL